MGSVRHLDLFSGIGGFAYAADNVWGDVEHIFCDNDRFCQQVLKKHWPEAKIYGDIKDITNTECKRWWQRPESETGQAARPDYGINLLTGGFPCQPFSAAGLRRGTADERHLWPEMLRVIRLTKPEWVIAENVRGLLTWNEGLVFEQVCGDLENEGYKVQPLVIPAVAVNAPHRRDRVWFVAVNPEYAGQHGAKDRKSSYKRSNSNQKRPNQDEQFARPAMARDDAENPVSQRRGGRSESSGQILERQSPETETPRPSSQSDSTDTRHQRQTKQELQTAGSEQYSWKRHWLEVATELCGVDDGLPVELDGFKLTKAQNRKEQLKAYGNAIVPQVAIEIMKGIATPSAGNKE